MKGVSKLVWIVATCLISNTHATRTLNSSVAIFELVLTGGSYNEGNCDGTDLLDTLLDDDKDVCCELSKSRTDGTLTITMSHLEVFNLIDFEFKNDNDKLGPTATSITLKTFNTETGVETEQTLERELFSGTQFWESDISSPIASTSVEMSWAFEEDEPYFLCAIDLEYEFASFSPTLFPTAAPVHPTDAPTPFPSGSPTTDPTAIPTRYPTPDLCPDQSVNQDCCARAGGVNSVILGYTNLNDSGAYVEDADYDEECVVNYTLNACGEYSYNKASGSLEECKDGDDVIDEYNNDVCNVSLFRDLSPLAETTYDSIEVSITRIDGPPAKAKCNFTLVLCDRRNTAVCEDDGNPFDGRSCSFDTAFIGNVTNEFSFTETANSVADCTCAYNFEYCLPLERPDTACFTHDVIDCCNGGTLEFEADEDGFPTADSSWSCDNSGDFCPDRWDGARKYTYELEFDWWYDRDESEPKYFCECGYALNECEFPSQNPTKSPTPYPTPLPSQFPSMYPSGTPTQTPTPVAEADDGEEDSDDDTDDKKESATIIPGVEDQMAFIIAGGIAVVIFLGVCCGCLFRRKDRLDREKRDKKREEIKRKKAEKARIAAQQQQQQQQQVAPQNTLSAAPAGEPVYQPPAQTHAPAAQYHQPPAHQHHKIPSHSAGIPAQPVPSVSPAPPRPQPPAAAHSGYGAAAAVPRAKTMDESISYEFEDIDEM